MATAAASLGGIGQSSELRQRLWFVLLALVIFRIGSHITIPGVDPNVMAAIFEQQRGGILDICLLYTSPSPRDATLSRMPSSA